MMIVIGTAAIGVAVVGGVAAAAVPATDRPVAVPSAPGEEPSTLPQLPSPSATPGRHCADDGPGHDVGDDHRVDRGPGRGADDPDGHQ